MCSEVFGNWPWVSNTLDSKKGCRIAVGWHSQVMGENLLVQSGQVMHFKVTFVHDHRKMLVSYVYADNSEKDRKALWRNLNEQSVLVGQSPWVLLGDFNVALNYEDCSNSFSVKDKDMQDFKECMKGLDIEVINSYGMFFTCIQKRRNPELGLLKKLDRVMGNGSFISSYGRSYANFFAIYNL